MSLLFAALLLASSDSQPLVGKYIRYEEAEYESAFIPCGSEEVWPIEGGPAFTELVEGYNKAPKNQYGEVMVALYLKLTPIDKNKYPQSHYAGIATVANVVSIGADVTCSKASS
jgi:hypothetical protein